MSIHFLCNIGSRDLMLRSTEGKIEEIRPARTRGLEILEHYPEYAGRLILPIIQPTLEHIFAMEDLAHSHEQPVTAQVYLLGTDQPDPRYTDTDTLHFARLASYKLRELFGSRVCVHEELVIDGINPAMYDEAYERMNRLLRDVQPGENDPVYILLAGGIPACNTALLLQGVRHFNKKLIAVYKPPDREAQFLRAGRQLSEAFSEAAIIERLEDLDFANALPDLERISSARDLAGLVRYATQRLAFDFQSARLTLEQTLADADHATRQFINDQLRNSLDNLLLNPSGSQRLLALLKELYWNACIVYDHHQYADFLGRVYRFQEAILRYLVEEIFHVATDLAPDVRDVNKKDWEEMLARNPALMAYCEKILVGGEKLNPRIIARPSYQALLNYATGDPPGTDPAGKHYLGKEQRAYYRTIVDKVNKLDNLVELRHRTIIGHDFGGVSEAMLIENTPDRVSAKSYLTSIMTILCRDKSITRSDYQEISHFVIYTLRERTL